MHSAESNAPYLQTAAPPADITFRAWRRWGAKIADLLIIANTLNIVLAIWVGAMITYLGGSQMSSYLSQATWLDVVLMGVAYLIYDSLCLRFFATSPGRWLFGLRVHTLEGAKLRLGAALKRSLLVLGLGMAGGIPVLVILVYICAFLRFREAGATEWDQLCGTQVSYREQRRITTVALAGAVLLLNAGVALSNYMAG